MQERLEQDLQQGLQQGREEERRILALDFLREGIALEVIARAMGLSIAQIQQQATMPQNPRNA
ncbi:MAG: hypothetical protein HC827_10210 [Cyanobacteria bacterium RM1_2_2]|nr:hypothetical protein [Cyanobacteria bacterium RM1_2_2]